MWSHEDFRLKAQTYFERAEVAESDDAAAFIWCALGLEFLLRAPLAKVNPALLADFNGPSILHACGFPSSKEPKSVAITTVLERIGTVVPDFTTEHAEDARFIIGMRNRELHTSDRQTLLLSRSTWLPKFLRVLEVLSAFFEEDASNYLDPGFLAHARKLADDDDRKLKAEIEKKISMARIVAGGLSGPEREARLAAQRNTSTGWGYSIDCPSCGEQVRAVYQFSRSGKSVLDEEDPDIIITPMYLVADTFNCVVCGLSLAGVREFAIARLPQEVQDKSVESMSDRVAEAFYEPDYGND